MRTVEDAEMKLWPFARPTHIMVREFMELNYSFTAFNGLPIAREFRLFADDKQVFCVHPYWPVDSLRFEGDEPENLEQIMAEHHQIPDEIEELKTMAMTACHLIGADHPWSVDFAQDKNGKWWLIDMACAYDSYHWEGCNAVAPEQGPVEFV